MNYYDESAKRRHKKLDVTEIDIKEECGDKNNRPAGTEPGDINFKTESKKLCKKNKKDDVVDFEEESAKSKKKKTKKDCCGSDECTETECKKNKKSKDEDAVDFENESCKTKKSKKVDVDFETEDAPPDVIEGWKKQNKDIIDAYKSKRKMAREIHDNSVHHYDNMPDELKSMMGDTLKENKKFADDMYNDEKKTYKREAREKYHNIDEENKKWDEDVKKNKKRFGDMLGIKTESAKTKKKDIDFETESSKCKGKKCKKNDELEIDVESLNDTKKKKKAIFDQECGDASLPNKRTKFVNEDAEDVDMSSDISDISDATGADEADVSDATLEFYINKLDKITLESLANEREVMYDMACELFKEYQMIEYNLSEEMIAQESGDYYQERFFGGTGKQAADLVKPVARAAKKINDYKHGVPKHGIIRNVAHRTGKDLHGHGFLYKLITWPFLILKNTVQTLYKKTKSFIVYKGLLIGVEVKINREIRKLRKNLKNVPKTALAGLAGYAATSLASVAKGEGLPLNPIEFIATEGATIIDQLGQDTMLRALTSKLADVVENSPEKIKEFLSKHKESNGSGEHLTPEMGKNADTVLSVKEDKIIAEHLININAINELVEDIDKWGEICDKVSTDLSSGNESNIDTYLDQARTMEKKYFDGENINYSNIYSKNASAVKISDFYTEFSEMLVEKTKSLEKGLNKITGLDNQLKAVSDKITEQTEKNLAELNKLMQHNCNAFIEIIDTLDDLGKYVMNTMNQYLNCLSTAATQIKDGVKKGRNNTDSEEE